MANNQQTSAIPTYLEAQSLIRDLQRENRMLKIENERLIEFQRWANDILSKIESLSSSVLQESITTHVIVLERRDG